MRSKYTPSLRGEEKRESDTQQGAGEIPKEYRVFNVQQSRPHPSAGSPTIPNKGDTGPPCRQRSDSRTGREEDRRGGRSEKKPTTRQTVIRPTCPKTAASPHGDAGGDPMPVEPKKRAVTEKYTSEHPGPLGPTRRVQKQTTTPEAMNPLEANTDKIRNPLQKAALRAPSQPPTDPDHALALKRAKSKPSRKKLKTNAVYFSQGTECAMTVGTTPKAQPRRAQPSGPKPPPGADMEKTLPDQKKPIPYQPPPPTSGNFTPGARRSDQSQPPQVAQGTTKEKPGPKTPCPSPQGLFRKGDASQKGVNQTEPKNIPQGAAKCPAETDPAPKKDESHLEGSGGGPRKDVAILPPKHNDQDLQEHSRANTEPQTQSTQTLIHPTPTTALPDQQPRPQLARRCPPPQPGRAQDTETQWIPPSPPQAERLPAPEELRNRIERLLELLHLIPEPLKSAIDRSRYALQIPESRFHVTSKQYYGPSSRRYATRMKTSDPLLLKGFVRADLSILLRDPHSTACSICEFTKNNYEITIGETAVFAEVDSLPRLMATVAEFLREKPVAWTNQSARPRDEQGKLHFYFYHVPHKYQGITPRTDGVLAAVREDRNVNRFVVELEASQGGARQNERPIPPEPRTTMTNPDSTDEAGVIYMSSVEEPHVAAQDQNHEAASDDGASQEGGGAMDAEADRPQSITSSSRDSSFPEFDYLEDDEEAPLARSG